MWFARSLWRLCPSGSICGRLEALDVVPSRRKSLSAQHEKSMVTLSNSELNQGIVVTTKRGGLLDRYFYFFMSLLIPAVVVYGFSFTVGKNLIHPAIPQPLILYVHAAFFCGWLVAQM
jgi:hypothetical protein